MHHHRKRLYVVVIARTVRFAFKCIDTIQYLLRYNILSGEQLQEIMAVARPSAVDDES